MEIKPLITGINVSASGNQFKATDFLSELTDSEKAVKTQAEMRRIYPLIKIFDHVPTHKPSNFNEQFAIYNNKLYAYINGAWALLN
jgi:hypothetical protein